MHLCVMFSLLMINKYKLQVLNDQGMNRIAIELNIAIKGIIEGITIEINLDEMLKMTK